MVQRAARVLSDMFVSHYGGCDVFIHTTLPVHVFPAFTGAVSAAMKETVVLAVENDNDMLVPGDIVCLRHRDRREPITGRPFGARTERHSLSAGGLLAAIG